jgi:hypothetical protein
VAAIALSFSFKLQAVFLMPIFLVFLFTKRIKIRHLASFPLSISSWSCLPFYWAGRFSTQSFYTSIRRAAWVGPQLQFTFHLRIFFSSDSTGLPSTLGIIASFVLVAAVVAILFVRRKSVTNRTLLAASLLFCRRHTSAAAAHARPVFLHGRCLLRILAVSFSAASRFPFLFPSPLCSAITPI